ncbi:MAG: AAA family ATPase [Bacteroidales bacterium]
MIGLTGARGVGKSTYLLQRIKETHKNDLDSVLYISLDNLFFLENDLIKIVDQFVNLGGKHLFIDEVHKYKNWSLALKNIYDNYPNLYIIFTSSSILDKNKGKADLSRKTLI